MDIDFIGDTRDAAVTWLNFHLKLTSGNSLTILLSLCLLTLEGSFIY